MITDDLAALVRNAVIQARDAGEFDLATEDLPVKIETPKDKLHGDYSSTVALALKKVTGLTDSREIAIRILKHLPQGQGLIDRVEIAGPGFLNFYLKPDWLQDTLVVIESEDPRYGTNTSRAGERILIEFVSANPTGPISVVNGRAAALGDVLGNLLAAQGCEVGREFYINDALNSLQLEKFSQTVAVRYLQQLGHPVVMPSGETEQGINLPDGAPCFPVHFPEGGYQGEYVKDIAKDIVAEVGDDLKHTTEEARNAYFRKTSLERMVATQRKALEAFGIYYDGWFYESSLYESGAVDRVIAHLKERGHAYEKDDALWLRSSALGDDKDRVLVRSNGKATYIAADGAYHDNKFQRGYSRLINILGADHHGYVARLKAVTAALGYDVSRLEFLLTQMVSLVRDGEAVVGGKRKGVVVELKEDLIDEVGKDAARFYFLLNSYDSPATVDVELAKQQSKENPVYYVQYAHARLSNILRKSQEVGIIPFSAEQADRSLLIHPSELDVLRKLADYPEEVRLAAHDYAPHRMTHYAMDLASLLNIFYENCQVLPREDKPLDPALTGARLTLVNGARIVLRNLLGLLGVSAPDSM